MSPEPAHVASVSPASRRARGVTVMEGVTGAAVLLAILGIALPTLDRTRHRLDGEVESLALVVDSARRLAVHRGYDLALTFDIVGNRIRIHHDVDADGAVDAGERTHDIPLRPDVAFGTGGAPTLDPASSPVSFKVRLGGRPALIFRRDGTASESGFIHIAPRESLAAGDRPEYARAIAVGGDEAPVSCLSFRSGRWEPSC